MKYFFSITVISIFFACNSTQKVAPNTPNDGPMIALETTGCRGFCPIFKLTFLQNGAAKYEGIRFVEKIGVTDFKISEAELAELKAALQSTDLWQYPETFPVTIMDGPGSILTISEGDKSKTIKGGIERPKPIQAIEQRLYQLAKTYQINLEAVNPNQIPTNVRKELIVKLQPTVNAGNWLRDINEAQQGSFKMQLVRRLSAENIWVVAYDSKTIKEKDVIELLKTSKEVIEAQPNREVKDRN